MPSAQLFSRLWKQGTTWLVKPVRAFRFARSLLKEGGHSIETPFTYLDNRFLLRTIIGFGDIINFIPNPEQDWCNSNEAAEWRNCYQTHVELHFQKINEFLHAFEKQIVFWDHSLKGMIGLANLYPIYQAIVMKEWVLLFSPIASTVYLYFFGKITAQNLVYGLWQLAKRLLVIRRKITTKKP